MDDPVVVDEAVPSRAPKRLKSCRDAGSFHVTECHLSGGAWWLIQKHSGERVLLGDKQRGEWEMQDDDDDDEGPTAFVAPLADPDASAWAVELCRAKMYQQEGHGEELWVQISDAAVLPMDDVRSRHDSYELDIGVGLTRAISSFRMVRWVVPYQHEEMWIELDEVYNSTCLGQYIKRTRHKWLNDYLQIWEKYCVDTIGFP